MRCCNSFPWDQKILHTEDHTYKALESVCIFVINMKASMQRSTLIYFISFSQGFSCKWLMRSFSVNMRFETEDKNFYVSSCIDCIFQVGLLLLVTSWESVHGGKLWLSLLFLHGQNGQVCDQQWDSGLWKMVANGMTDKYFCGRCAIRAEEGPCPATWRLSANQATNCNG
jgi:hypothetical protein